MCRAFLAGIVTGDLDIVVVESAEVGADGSVDYLERTVLAFNSEFAGRDETVDSDILDGVRRLAAKVCGDVFGGAGSVSAGALCLEDFAYHVGHAGGIGELGALDNTGSTYLNALGVAADID